MRIGNRILLASLVIIDRLFGTSFVEREVARRKAEVARHEARLSEIGGQLVKLGELLETANLQLCLLYLRQRNLLLPHRWLYFDLANSQEDEGLDLLIHHLVKPRLAAIEMQEASSRGSARGIEKDRYVYRLSPDWTAISGLLAERQADLQPEIAEWLKTLQKGLPT